MNTCKRLLAILMTVLFVTGALPVTAAAEEPDYKPGHHTEITLSAGSAKDYWTNTLSYLVPLGDRNGMIMTDDSASAGESGAVYQKLVTRSNLFDKAFTKAETEEGCDIVVQKGETFYITVKHGIHSSGYVYLTGFDAVLTYAAGAFSPKAIGGKFGSHPANQLMGQTVFADNTANVQKAALASGLMSEEYEYSLTQALENGKEGICVRLTNPSLQKPPIASQTKWDVLIPLTANEAGLYTIKYATKIGSASSSMWYADQLLSNSSHQVFSSEEQFTEGCLRVNDLRIRVLSDGPEFTAAQSAIHKEGRQQVTLKLNKGGSFHEAAYASTSVWNNGVLSGGTVTAVQKISSGLGEGETAVRLTIDTSGVLENQILIAPDTAITPDYAGCGQVLLELVTKPDASVNLSVPENALLKVSSATDRYRISGDTEWTIAGAKTIRLTGNTDENGPLDRLQAAVAEGKTVLDAITVISQNDDPAHPAAASKVSVSRAAAPASLSIDFENEKITGVTEGLEYAFGDRMPDTFIHASAAGILMTGHEPGTSLYYRTKPADAATTFPSHVQSLSIPERPVLLPITTNTSIPDKESGCTVLQLDHAGTGLVYSINSGGYTDLTGERIPATASDTISIRMKATDSVFCSDEQQLNGEGYSYGTVTGHANYGTTTASLQLKDNGATFEKADPTPVEVVVFNRADGSKIKSLEATVASSAGDTVMSVTLTQSTGKNSFTADSPYGYYVVLPAGMLSEKQDVNQHKTLGESSVSARGFAEISVAENGHRIVESTAVAASGSGKDIHYSIQLSESFIPTGSAETEITVHNLRDGEQINAVTVNGAAVSIIKSTYNQSTGTASFLYPAITCDGALDVSISVETQPVVRQLSGTDISWEVGSVTKVYDGSSKVSGAVLSSKTTMLYDGHSDIQIKAASIDFTLPNGTKTADAGTGLKMIASGLTITGADSFYYKLPENLTVELAANGSITKAKADGLSLAAPVAVQGNAVNVSQLIDKLFSSKVLVLNGDTAAPLSVPLSDLIGSTENTADRNRLTGALFAFTARTPAFEEFLYDNLSTAMAILSVTPASGEDTNASTVKNRQAVLTAAGKLDNPENSGQAAVMRGLLQAYLNSFTIGSTFTFQLSLSVLSPNLTDGNYDFSSLNNGISGSIAIKAEGHLDDDGETDGDLYLVIYEVDPLMGRLTGSSAQKVRKDKTSEAIPSVTANARYTFEGWLLNGKTANPAAMAITADVTFTASFTKGFMQGDGNGGVRPNSQISRAEFVKMAVYTFGTDFSPDTDYDVSMYGDVLESQWYRAVVGYATKMDWVSGHDGKFRPGDKITRQEAAKLVSAAMGTVPVSGNSTFTDTASISGWAVPYISALTQKGILGGYEDGSFQPLRNISRAEAASMVGKADGFKPDEQRRKTIKDTVTLPFTDISTGHWGYPDIAYACGAIDH